MTLCVLHKCVLTPLRTERQHYTPRILLNKLETNKSVDRNLTFYRQVFSNVFQFNIVCSYSTYFSYSSYPYQTLQSMFVPKVNIICSDDNFSFNAHFTFTQLPNRHRRFRKPFRSTHITSTELLSKKRKLTHWDGQLDS